MKKFIITVSETFPKGHINEGLPTNFVKKIIDSVKIHTIRSNFEFWAKRIKQIQEGEGYLSIRVWEGKPYASKQKEIAKITAEDGIGIQKTSLEFGSFNIEVKPGFFLVKSVKDIAKNDGLSKKDFDSWFNGNFEELAIIHFTSFRY